MIGIGIDTGGTCTDGVIYDDATGEVLAKTKTLTTRDDLTKCIGTALDKLPADLVARAERVSLSTTLATNACVEGKGGRARLVIVGTTDDVLHRVKAPQTYGLTYSDVLALDFRGSADGTKASVPNWQAVCDAHPEFFAEADSFGIAGLYALNNGAIVERTGAEYLRERYGKSVVMATSVADSLNVMERGATALLNARLLPVIDEFIQAMRVALARRGLNVPIGIVRSNGALMSAEFAQTSPVETIVSGPAASAVGALALANAEEGLIIDIGGTTSDICVVHGGRPVSSEGIRIGNWRTQVKGASIDTIGLGGDSELRITKDGKLEMDRRRVMPACIAAHKWPQVKKFLKRYVEEIHPSHHLLFEAYYLAKEPVDPDRFTRTERKLIDDLREGPMSLTDRRLDDLSLDPRRLENEGVIMRIGVTPTDAMHVLGDYTAYDTEASYLGILCLAKSFRRLDPALRDEIASWMAERVYQVVYGKLYRQIVRVLLQDRYPELRDRELSADLQTLIDNAWQRFLDGTPPTPFDVNFTTSMTLVGIGAPTHVFLPTVARALGAPCFIPEHAAVANAIGAICAEIIGEASVRVVPHRVSDGVVDGYMIMHLEENRMVKECEDALNIAQDEARRLAIQTARERGVVGEITCIVDVDRINILGNDATTPFEWTIRAIAQPMQAKASE